jgi:acetyl-CoA carboxylase biotin carboxyl carrier protein
MLPSDGRLGLSGDLSLGLWSPVQVSRKDAMMAEKDADIERIRELLHIMKENDLVKIDIQHGDDRIALERAQSPQPGVSLPGAAIPILTPQTQRALAGQIPTGPKAEELLEIKSPLVGTFYEAPSPDSDPYVEPGSHVDSQTVVCIVEAMKVMNEIKAEVGGTIVEKVATNGQAVEYGQVLFRVRPD